MYEEYKVNLDTLYIQLQRRVSASKNEINTDNMDKR